MYHQVCKRDDIAWGLSFYIFGFVSNVGFARTALNQPTWLTAAANVFMGIGFTMCLSVSTYLLKINITEVNSYKKLAMLCEQFSEIENKILKLSANEKNQDQEEGVVSTIKHEV